MRSYGWSALATACVLSGCQYYDVNGGVCGDPSPCTGADCFDFGDPTSECRANDDCGDAEVCAEGVCVSVDDSCWFDLHCGPGRGCVDNACRPFCTVDADCTSGTACTDGRCLPAVECSESAGCAAGEECVEDRCLLPCSSDADCGEEELCTLGHCRPNVAPRPFCTTDADCETGHLCVDGVCRTPCPDGTDEACQRADTALIRCGASATGLLLCYTHSETNPECLVAEDCASGERCADAICR